MFKYDKVGKFCGVNGLEMEEVEEAEKDDVWKEQVSGET